MKKILFILLTLQNLCMTAQTETLVTPNGKKVYIDASPQWSLDGNINAQEKSLGTRNTFDLPVITNNIEKMRITKEGKLLINTQVASDPNAIVQLKGQPGTLQIVDGTQGQNKVLTSDANGVATWKVSAVRTERFRYNVTHPAVINMPFPGRAITQFGDTFNVPVSGIYRFFSDVNIPPGYILWVGSHAVYYSQSDLRFHQYTLVYLEEGANSVWVYNDHGAATPEIGGPYWTFIVEGPVN